MSLTVFGVPLLVLALGAVCAVFARSRNRSVVLGVFVILAVIAGTGTYVVLQAK